MATPSFGSGAAAAHGQGEAQDAAATAAHERESKLGHAEIEIRAYFIYLEEGGGDPGDHWNRAERELSGQSAEQQGSADSAAGDNGSSRG